MIASNLSEGNLIIYINLILKIHILWLKNFIQEETKLCTAKMSTSGFGFTMGKYTRIEEWLKELWCINCEIVGGH